MAANNAIGTGAVILTANADQLLSGLDKAEKATGQWAADTTKKVSAVADSNRRAYDALTAKGTKLAGYMPDVDYSKSMGGPDKGGEKGGGLGALATGGIAGIAAGATMKGLEFLTSLPEKLKELQEASGQGAGGPLGRMVAAVETLQKIGTQLIATVLSPLAPAFERVAEIANGFWERLQPIAESLGQRIGGAVFSLVEVTGSWLNVFLTGLEAVWPLLDRVFRAAEVGLFLLETLYTLVYDGISEIIRAISGWVDSLGLLDSVTLTVSQAMFKALKWIAQTAGYVWDVFRYGAGVIAESLGSVIEVALRSVLSAFRELASLAKEIPSYLRPDWLDGFIGALDRADGAVGGIGAKIEAWGRNAQKGFGQSAGIFGAAIDALQARFEARQKRIADSTHKATEQLKEVKLSGALLGGSNEAYAAVTRDRVGQMFAAQNRGFDVKIDETAVERNPVARAVKDQTKELREVKRAIIKLVDRSERAIPIEIIP